MIDKKIQAVLDLYNGELDETKEDDFLLYCELRDYVHKNGGLFYFYRDRKDYYMVVDFTDEEDFFIAPVECLL